MPTPEELLVLSRWFRWRDAPDLLRQHLNEEAFRLLDEREAQIAGLRTAADWRQRQASVRHTLERLLGPFPERTPLNARVTDKVDRQGFRVEKVVFESRPGFHVTGCLFVPEQMDTPAPAILNPIGHTDIAFRAESYQTLILNFVRKGFVVLAYDPPGQGERLQYFDPALGQSRIGGSTREHSYFGRQCFLTGRSPGHYFAWDGIRAIDYLLTRPEVDPRRIGVTGISGGGTQTVYIAVLDDRVAAAAPTCYITSFRRLLESIGPQDAEQNLLHGLDAGIDHADFLEVRAPKPALVVATTRDFFSIQGARETCAEVAGAYAALGAPEAFGLVEDDHGHGYTPRTREALYRFFQQALELPGNPRDEPVEYLDGSELTVTETGQVSTSLSGESVFSLNRVEAVEHLGALRARRTDLSRHLPEALEAARRLSGYVPPDAGGEGPASSGEPGTFFLGRLHHDAGAIEKVVLPSEGACIVPALVLVPPSAVAGERHPAAVLLHPDGKGSAAADDSVALALARQGWIVLLPDLSQTGELASAEAGRRVEFETALLGRGLPGIRAGEIVQAVRYLQSRPDTRPDGILVAAWGELGPALLHAAAFEPAIERVALIDAPLSWQGIVLDREYETSFGATVPGALASYDLPDLAASFAPRPLAAFNPIDHRNRALEDAQAEWAVVERAYAAAGARAHLTLASGIPPAEVPGRLLSIGR
jgi:dienelactone hydrolase